MIKKKETIINTEPDISKFKSPNDMCLMDDILMNLVFDNCVEATQEVLRIILKKDDIVVKESKAQSNIFSGLNEKTVRLDILATDSSGSLYDIEVQNAKDASLLNRAIYYSSLLNLKSLTRGDEYLNTRHSFVIFICDFDYFSAGRSMYHISRNITELPAMTINHPDEIIIVNGTYQKEDPIGLLMRDFHNSNVNDINNKILKERSSYFKETKEGQGCMSEYIQRVYKDDFDNLKINNALDYAIAVTESLNISIDKAFDILKLDNDLRQKVVSKLADRKVTSE